MAGYGRTRYKPAAIGVQRKGLGSLSLGYDEGEKDGTVVLFVRSVVLAKELQDEMVKRFEQ